MKLSEVRGHSTRPGTSRIVAAILIGVVAALVVNSLPVFLTVLARARGLNESQSGLIAFADMGGIALGTTFCALSPRVVEYLTWRWVTAFGLLLLCAANILSIVVPGIPTLLVARTLAGCGSGLAMAVTYAVLAQGDGARELAIFNVAQIGVGSLAMLLLGPIADRYGAGAIYGYLSFMGIAWGGRASDVESSLSAVMFASMMGGVVVSVVGSRFGLTRPMYAGSVVLLASIVLLATVQPVHQFVLLGGVFGFAWNIVTPYQFEAVTLIDESSSAAMLVNAATLGGLAVGPAVAGFLATPTYFRVNMLALGMCVVSLSLLGFVLRLRRMVSRPAQKGTPS